MMTIINRLLIIAVMAFGVWFIVRHWDSVEMPVTESPEEIVFDTDTEQSMDEDLNIEFDSNVSFEEPVSETKKEKLTITVTEETPVVPVKPVAVVQPKVVTAPIVVSDPVVTPSTVAVVNSNVKVYLFDGGFDLSVSTIPAGHVTFTVRNDGRVSHDFSIKGVADFGRVTPGSVLTFEADLKAGEYVLYSPRELDQALDMRETLRVENAQ